MSRLDHSDGVNFEQHLMTNHSLSQENLQIIKQIEQDYGETFILSLIRSKVIPEQQLLELISEYYRIPILQEEDITENIIHSDQISSEFLIQNKICPITETPHGIIVAVADPSDVYSIDAIKLALQKKVIPKLILLDDLEVIIANSKFSEKNSNIWVETTDETENADDIRHLKDIALDAPIVRFVNELFLNAIRARATDIHVEPFNENFVIRFRIDGILQQVDAPPIKMAKAIVSRIKIVSGLDIAERRLPQDGRARLKIEGQKLDLRIATVPTIHGESVTIRVLTNVRRNLDFTKLGFNSPAQKTILKQLSSPHGMFIVTGPTGSGKTTTLAAGLNHLNDSQRKILTIEDPIEYEIEGINQTAVKASIGLTFARSLRSFLRHDPDVIMVGEMRDSETAAIGVHAALTGHLVMTTLHTNSAAGAIPRLIDMGVDAFLLSSSLRGIVGQRLVRVLCQHCAESYTGTLDFPEADMHLTSKTTTLWRAVGCERCNHTGYSDRIVISEILEINEEIQKLIQPGISSFDIEKKARQLGMQTMIDDGLQKCLEGITTPEEVRRVATTA